MQKRMIHAFIGCAATAAILGCQSANSPADDPAGFDLAAAQGKGAVQQTMPIALTVPDCGGGTVSASGRLHTVTRVQQDGQGRYHVVVHGNFQDLIGVDAAGDTLAGEGAGQVTGKFDSLPQVVADTFQVIFLSADSGDTLIVNVTATITISADGTILIGCNAMPIPVCGPDTSGTDTSGVGSGTSLFSSAPPGEGLAVAGPGTGQVDAAQLKEGGRYPWETRSARRQPARS
jgi:hypothetical protein